MKTNHDLCTILNPVNIELNFSDLAARLSTTGQSGLLLETAKPIFTEAENSWTPRAVFSWLQVMTVTESETNLALPVPSDALRLETGFAGSFLQTAEMVLAGVYTSGSELERAARNASASKRYLEGYIFEQVSLLVLEKTANAINNIVEQEAARRNWGVGPLLSPGSVHGWELTDQPNLCSHLPIDQINVVCSDNGVLSPFNSLSFVIGIGPGYTGTTVGSPCKVCNNRDTCTLRKENTIS